MGRTIADVGQTAVDDRRIDAVRIDEGPRAGLRVRRCPTTSWRRTSTRKYAVIC
ncbi:Uncharacterised protein [Mycobacteroides abscessus subsp. abscessus]|nr:Uncharacterised protein [Mycobacteroides abscessus subsp. abscessus]